MNIFYLDDDPIQCAKYHVDKHIVKMITEYCQLLSTAHRLLDGMLYYATSKNGRKIKRWSLPDDRENVLFKATHVNHPSNVWTRESLSNYMMLFKLYIACIAEYKYRYGKIHGSSRPSTYLVWAPKNIPDTCLLYTSPSPRDRG